MDQDQIDKESKLKEFWKQKYILNQDEFTMLKKDLKVNELKYVSEFFGVLDAQILKL